MRRRATAAGCPGWHGEMSEALAALAAVQTVRRPDGQLAPSRRAALAAGAAAVDEVRERLCLRCESCDAAWLEFTGQRLRLAAHGDPRGTALESAPYVRAAGAVFPRLWGRLDAPADLC
jgi:hypothetical protein